MDFVVGDKIVSKKVHPCGGNVWTVVRTGADYKIRCDKCGRVVMLSYSDFLKTVKSKGSADV